jgi:hypothetical protein
LFCNKLVVHTGAKGQGFVRGIRGSSVVINPPVIHHHTITVARILKESATLRKNGRKLVWGSHRPLHGVANVKSSVANDETGFKVFNFKEPIRK